MRTILCAAALLLCGISLAPTSQACVDVAFSPPSVYNDCGPVPCAIVVLPPQGAPPVKVSCV